MSNKIPYNVLRNRPMAAGAVHTKDAPETKLMSEEGLKKLSGDLSDAVGLMEGFQKKFEEQGRALASMQKDAEGQKALDAETKASIEKMGKEFADTVTKMQACEQAVELLKKEMDAPLYRSDKDLAEKDRENAIELQRRHHIFKGGSAEDFKADLDNLVDMNHYRAACQVMVQKGGLETTNKSSLRSMLTEDQKKAFDAASLDSGFFMPEMLGMEVDCEIECASMVDLYEQITVSRSNYMFPHVQSYGDIGQYTCDAQCDAEYGPEGNITWKNGNTYDFRGVFCFQRDTLREANYDLLGFMMRAAARSYRINRNQALITGDGVNEPLGWLTADCFSKISTPAANPTHQDLRQFFASAPVEYGLHTAVMHQNTFAYFASMVDSNGRFIFGDGLMGFSPGDVVDRVRISNCLPDPTEGGTKGSAASPFDTGSFVMAYGNWPRAYGAVNHRPMFMEQHLGGSTAWCVRYQFGAKDGGQVLCCPAARTLQAG